MSNESKLYVDERFELYLGKLFNGQTIGINPLFRKDFANYVILQGHEEEFSKRFQTRLIETPEDPVHPYYFEAYLLPKE